jgi:hypothetical protein
MSEPLPPALIRRTDYGRPSRMWLRMRAVFAWREVNNTGAWSYLENKLTGERRAVRIDGAGHQPLDSDWLAFKRDYVGDTSRVAQQRR